MQEDNYKKLQSKIIDFAIEVLNMEETKKSPEMVAAISRLVGSKELF
ncbi:hypothetical protein [Lactiplantibacillus plantarum]|nr:hypothetical protein [Lactiplantibacillus plantarum]MBA3076985.1 hypothetical protein [Lactiplantibacillus plantarum]MBA3080181.1 hypothetical protein [Lactiplantibacillus plantarum]MBA3082785.1 hypothetical protein [Lactiplantibacillus plantarum]MBO2714165.1 hypothetical protein [Lactiplantibacillus plantarum]MDT4760833.1 hypothetical protein [Lactiplantibacillus plantarum]